MHELLSNLDEAGELGMLFIGEFDVVELVDDELNRFIGVVCCLLVLFTLPFELLLWHKCKSLDDMFDLDAIATLLIKLPSFVMLFLELNPFVVVLLNELFNEDEDEDEVD
jgi:hypothetical protein